MSTEPGISIKHQPAARLDWVSKEATASAVSPSGPGVSAKQRAPDASLQITEMVSESDSGACPVSLSSRAVISAWDTGAIVGCSARGPRTKINQRARPGDSAGAPKSFGTIKRKCLQAAGSGGPPASKSAAPRSSTWKQRG